MDSLPDGELLDVDVGAVAGAAAGGIVELESGASVFGSQAEEGDDGAADGGDDDGT